MICQPLPVTSYCLIYRTEIACPTETTAGSCRSERHRKAHLKHTPWKDTAPEPTEEKEEEPTLKVLGVDHYVTTYPRNFPVLPNFHDCRSQAQ